MCDRDRTRKQNTHAQANENNNKISEANTEAKLWKIVNAVSKPKKESEWRINLKQALEINKWYQTNRQDFNQRTIINFTST